MPLSGWRRAAPNCAGQYLYSPELASLLAGDPRLPALRRKIGLPE
jgi:hypothetical protein